MLTFLQTRAVGTTFAAPPWAAIAEAIQQITRQHCLGFFTATGFGSG